MINDVQSLPGSDADLTGSICSGQSVLCWMGPSLMVAPAVIPRDDAGAIMSDNLDQRVSDERQTWFRMTRT
jgi:hypothetical protein